MAKLFRAVGSARWTNLFHCCIPVISHSRQSSLAMNVSNYYVIFCMLTSMLAPIIWELVSRVLGTLQRPECLVDSLAS